MSRTTRNITEISQKNCGFGIILVDTNNCLLVTLCAICKLSRFDDRLYGDTNTEIVILTFSDLIIKAKV